MHLAGQAVVLKLCKGVDNRLLLRRAGIFDRLGHHISRIIAEHCKLIGVHVVFCLIVLNEILNALILALRRILAAIVSAVNRIHVGLINLADNAVPTVCTDDLRRQAELFGLYGDQCRLLIISRHEEDIRILRFDIGKLRAEIDCALCKAFVGSNGNAELLSGCLEGIPQPLGVIIGGVINHCRCFFAELLGVVRHNLTLLRVCKANAEHVFASRRNIECRGGSR